MLRSRQRDSNVSRAFLPKFPRFARFAEGRPESLIEASSSEVDPHGEGREFYVSEVKFSVNPRGGQPLVTSENNAVWRTPTGGAGERSTKSLDFSDSSDDEQQASKRKEAFSFIRPSPPEFAGYNNSSTTRTTTTEAVARPPDMLAPPENHYQRSLTPSPNVTRRLLTVPSYMDDESGRQSPAFGEEASAMLENGGGGGNGFNKNFNYSIKSTASVYSAGIGELATWAESDEAKSSLISVLSALYAMVLVILSLAFEVSIAVVDSVHSAKYDIFYIYLYSVSLAFFFYCEFFLLRSFGMFSLVNIVNKCRQCCSGQSRKPSPPTLETRKRHDEAVNEEFLRKRRISLSLKRKASHSASSAGSLYLRMGCVVFGVVGLIMKGLQLFAAFDRRISSVCFSRTWVAETVLTAVFIFVQMFFIFQNSKLIIHRFKTVGRFGAMHLVATNLCTWIRSLVEEQMTIMHEINGGHSSQPHQPTSSKKHHGRHEHRNDQTRTLNHSTPDVFSNLTNQSTDAACASAGARYGANSLIADVEPFTTTCIIEYSLICAAVMYILWRNIGHVPRLRVRQRKQRFHVDCTASTQGLFLGLLFMVYTIVSMVIFFTKVRSGANEDALIVFYTAYIVLFGGSIGALAVGMYRMRNLYYLPGQKKKNLILLDDILLIVGLVGQLMYCVFSVVPMNEVGFTTTLIVVSSLLRMVQVLWQTVFIFFAQRLATLSPELQEKNPGREMVTFLLMTNLALFLINTFETHKAGAIPNLFGFYGEAVWMVIAHSTIPLCIFYRFHSTVCLAEVWKHVYRVKAGESAV